MRELTSRISHSPSNSIRALTPVFAGYGVDALMRSIRATGATGDRCVTQGVEFFAHTPMSGLLPGPRPPRHVAALSLVKLVGFLAAPHQAVTMISSASHSATQLAWLQVVRTT